MGMDPIFSRNGVHRSVIDSRFFLVYTGIFDRSSLPREIRWTAPWILCSTVALILVMWTMVAIVVVAHPGLASLLAILGTGGCIEYLVFIRALDRALLDDLDRG